MLGIWFGTYSTLVRQNSVMRNLESLLKCNREIGSRNVDHKQ